MVSTICSYFRDQKHLSRAAVDDLGSAADGTGARAESLDGLDVLVAAGDLAEDDVLAIQPAGLDGGDEELGAVADGKFSIW